MGSFFTSRSRSTIVAAVCIAVLAFALMGVVAGCGDSGTIVGTWADADGVEAEFTADGKVLADDMAGMDATYVAEDGKLTITVMGMAFSLDYTVDGDKLTTTDTETGEVSEMTRVK